MTNGNIEHAEVERCPTCGAAAQAGTGSEDGTAILVFGCGHTPKPEPVESLLQPGSNPDCDYCGECARGGTCQ